VGVLPDVDGQLITNGLPDYSANASQACAAQLKTSFRVGMIVVTERRELGNEEVVVTVIRRRVLFNVGEFFEGLKVVSKIKRME
jgi:hypothetical protein